jgi:FtsZ-interacting cell division protein ZipA
MFYHFTNAQIYMAVIILVIVAIIVGEYLRRRKAKTATFRKRFGSEYNRTVQEQGSSDKAEANLADRESRVHALKIRNLDFTEREQFAAKWQAVQSRFLDHPEAAVTEADDLIAALLEARGYPKGSFDQRAADVSVLYSDVMENYRAAHAIAVLPYRAEESTEKLRTAMLQYRAIFNEIVQDQSPQEKKSAA